MREVVLEEEVVDRLAVLARVVEVLDLHEDLLEEARRERVRAAQQREQDGQHGRRERLVEVALERLHLVFGVGHHRDQLLLVRLERALEQRGERVGRLALEAPRPRVD
jgi:hypothetical protein